MSRKPIFDAIKAARHGQPFSKAEVGAIDALLDALGVPGEGRVIGAAGLALIKEFEGRELTAYRDPVGIWTIGYGSTGDHVKPGMTITDDEAEDLLRKDLSRFEAAVNKLTGGVVTQGQFDALTSFAFNVGEHALKTSTLLRLHNEGDYAAAAAQFRRWNKAGGRVLAGLTRRRAAEAELYQRGHQ